MKSTEERHYIATCTHLGGGEHEEGTGKGTWEREMGRYVKRERNDTMEVMKPKDSISRVGTNAQTTDQQRKKERKRRKYITLCVHSASPIGP